MGYQQHRQESPRSVNCAVVTISDSRTEKTDESGRFIRQKLSEKGHQVIDYCILRNNAGEIRKKIEELMGLKELQVIITSGGTGIGRRDITVETIEPLLEKRLDGFGELFRLLSYQEIASGSIMSRATGGVAGGRVILCLPGSLGAVTVALEKIILPEIGHLVREASR